MTITIDEAVRLVSEWHGKEIFFEPISGGMTNSNFKVSVNGSLFFVSISGKNARLLGVDWHNKFYNAKICGEAGLAPKVVQSFPLQGMLVLEYLPNTLCSVESLQCLAVQRRLVHTVKKLHSGGSFWKDFDMFRLIKFYMETIKDLGLALPRRYADYTEQIWEMGAELRPYRDKLVPCHNDLVPENIMDNGDRVFLLDFDYSGNNDPCFDLGSIAVESGFDDSQVRELARTYYGEIDEKVIARIHLHSVLADIGWSLWSLIQTEISDIDFNFIDYGLKRWKRALGNMVSSEFDIWLGSLGENR